MSTVVESPPRLYTEADLWRLSHEGARYELIEGKLHEMAPAGGEHGRITKRLDHYLTDYIYEHQLGECFAAETGFSLTRNPDTALAPDWAFVRTERLPDPIPDGYLPVAPDLVLETRSPGDRRGNVEKKIQVWLQHGVRVVLDLDPRRRTLGVLRPESEAIILTETDELTLPELPGLLMRLDRVFPS